MKSSPARSLQTVILTLLVVGLIVLGLGGYLTPLSRIILAPILTAQTWLSTHYMAIQVALSAPQDMARLRQRNLELEAEVSRLQTDIIELQQQIAETRILSALVDFARAHPENRYLGGAVIGRDPSPFLQYVIINRGSDDGLRRGMPVVSSKGLVGRVAAVTANAARVQLLTDDGSTVNIRLDPSGAQAMLVGSLGQVSLEMIPQTVNTQIGDLVLTSGLGGGYPANILIGQIASVRKQENQLFQEAAVQPVVDFSNLEIVLVITNFQPVDLSPLMITPTPGGQ